MPKQGLANGIVAFTRSNQERSRAVLAECVDVGLHSEEVPTDLGVADIAGLMERRVAIGALRIQVATLLDKELEDWGFPAVRGLLKQRSTLCVPQLHAHALRDQEPNALGVAALAKFPM